MAFSSELFEEVIIDPGSFSAPGTSTLRTNRLFVLEVDGRSFSTTVSGTVTLSFRAEAAVNTVHVDAVMSPAVPGVPRYEVTPAFDTLAPNPDPRISVQASASAPLLGIAESSLALALLDSDLSAAALAPTVSQFSAALAAQFDAELERFHGALLGEFPLSGFPFHDALPQVLRDGLPDELRDASDLPALIKAELGLRFDAECTAVQSELQRLAAERVAQLQPMFLRAAEVLLALGAPWSTWGLPLRTRLLAEWREGDLYVDALQWLLHELQRRNPALASGLVVEVMLASTGAAWAAAKGPVAQLLDSALALLPDDAELRSAWLRARFRDVLAGLEAAGRLAAAGPMLAGLLVMQFERAGKAWPAVSTSVEEAVRSMQRSGADLGSLLGPFFDALSLTSEQALDLLRSLRDDAVLRSLCTWVLDHWQRTKRLFEDLRQAIEEILGRVARWPLDRQRELRQLAALFDGLQALRPLIFDAPELRDVAGQVQRLALLLRDPATLARQLEASARAQKTTMKAVLAQAATQGNEAFRLVDRLHAAMSRLFTAESGNADRRADQLARGLAELQTLEHTLWSIVFAGASGEPPFSVAARIQGIDLGPAAGAGGGQVGGKAKAFAASLSPARFEGGEALSLEGRIGRLSIPHPADYGPLVWEQQGHVRTMTVPAAPVAPADAALAVSHLPRFWIFDMRYQMPYGDIGRYLVADVDGDGMVGGQEVAAVAAAATNDALYRAVLDSDADGRVTARDCQLAIDQQTRWVGGVMYRPVTAPLGFWISPAPGMWAFAAFTTLQDERIPNRVERRGYVWVLQAQLLIPRIDYPLRLHCEVREFEDRFPSIALSQVAPPPLTLSRRFDLVAQGGDKGRDFQLHASSEPMNPVLRTWVLRASGYLRAIATGAYFGVGAEAGAGVAGKQDVRVQVVYETKSPLIAVLAGWHDRFEHLRQTRPQDLPVPFQLMRTLLEYTDLPRMTRAQIGFAGPFMDLLFDWTDPGARLRAAWGHVRQTVSAGWRPGMTWRQLAEEVSGWPAAEIPAPCRVAVQAGVAAAQRHLGAVDSDPCWAPMVVVPMAERALEGVQAGAAGIAAAQDKLRRWAGADRQRFVAGLDQFVGAAGGPAETILIRGIGVLRRVDIHVWVMPDPRRLQRWQDTRGNPLRRPLYKSRVVFGGSAALYSAPVEDELYRVADVGSASGPDQTGVVEGRFVLEDTRRWWFFVSTQDGRFGWVALPRSAAGPAYEARAARDTMLRALAPDLLADAAADATGSGGPPLPLVWIEASPPEAIDDTAEAWRMHQALADPTANPRHIELVKLRREVIEELRTRVFGLGEAGRHDDASLAATFKALPHATQCVLWAHAGAWLKCRHYSVRLAVTALERIVPLLIESKWEEALVLVREMLRRSADFSAEEAMLACQAAAPYAREIVVTLIDIAKKIKRIKQSVSDGTFDGDFQGELAPAGVNPRDPTLSNLGQYLLRMLIDDGAAPGAKRASNLVQQRRGRRNRDKGIKFGGSLRVENIGTPQRGSALPAGAAGASGAAAADGPSDAELQQRTELEARYAARVPPAVYRLMRNATDAQRDAYDAVLARRAAGGPDEPRWRQMMSEELRARCDLEARCRALLDDYSARINLETGAAGAVDLYHWVRAMEDPDKPTTEADLRTIGQFIQHDTLPNSLERLNLRARQPGDSARIRFLRNELDTRKLVRERPGHDQTQLLRDMFVSTSREAADLAEQSVAETVPAETYAAIKDLNNAERRAYMELQFYEMRAGEGTEARQELDASTSLVEAEVRLQEAAYKDSIVLNFGQQAYEETRDMNRVQRARHWRNEVRRQRAELAAEDKAADATLAKKESEQKKKFSGSLRADFGDDMITVTFCSETGVGAGAGASAGAGAGAAPTGNIKYHVVHPKFSADLLLEPDTVAMALRFVLRFAYHALDAANLGIEWAKAHPPGKKNERDETLGSFADAAFWGHVFLVFAIKDAVFDIANDHGAFVAALLEKLGWEFEVDASVAVSGDIGVSAELNDSAVLKAYVPMSVLLAPLLDFLVAGAKPAADGGASLVDRILPRIQVSVWDHLSMKVGGFPAALEIESRGKLAEASLTIPKGSPLRAGLQTLSREVALAADHYRKRRLANVPDEFAKLRLVLDLLDKEMLALVRSTSRWNQAAESASSLAGDILAMARGDTPSTPGAGAAEGSKRTPEVVRLLQKARTRGVEAAAGVLLVKVATPRRGVFALRVHVSDEEKTRLDDEIAALGDSPLAGDFEAAGESFAMRVALPITPLELRWETRDPVPGVAGSAMVQGIVAGFDTVEQARIFATRRPAAWVGDADLRSLHWAEEGRFWAWVDTRLVDELAKRGCPLPDLSVGRSAMGLRFRLVAAPGLPAATASLLSGASLTAHTSVWKVLLMVDAQEADCRSILGTLTG